MSLRRLAGVWLLLVVLLAAVTAHAGADVAPAPRLLAAVPAKPAAGAAAKPPAKPAPAAAAREAAKGRPGASAVVPPTKQPGPAPSAAPAEGSQGLPPLIPLQLLLGESKYSNPQLSNDGSLLAYIKPDAVHGVPNVFVRRLQPGAAGATAAAVAAARRRSSSTTGAAAAAFRKSVAADVRVASLFDREAQEGADQQVTFDSTRGVSAYSWAEDGSAIFFIQDDGGDENYHLYTAPVRGKGGVLDLTPFPGVKAQGILSNELFPDRLYIGLNRRDPAVFDMYLLNLTTLTLALDTLNPGDVSTWLLDADFRIRGAECYNNTDGSSYIIINDGLPKQATPAPAAARAAQARLAAMQRARAGAPRTQADVRKLEGLFAKAAKQNWGAAQWVAASSSRADVTRWRRLLTWPFGEEGGVFRFNAAGDALYVIDSHGRDTTEFQLISTAPGARVLQRIASDPLAAVGPVEFHPRSWAPQLVSFNYLQVRWRVLDPAMQQEWGRIESFRPGEEANIVDRSGDDKTWILGYSSDSANSKYFLHQPGSWPPTPLFDTQPELLRFNTARMHSVVIPARDGLQLPAYLTLPVKAGVPQTAALPPCVAGRVPDLTPQQRGAAAAAAAAWPCPLRLGLPLVLAVHGGPWSRDTWGGDGVVQMLANRGYAVLQVNYRGSTGYGKRFMAAGNKQWGIGAMQHDLTDAVRWAVAKGVADPSRVCIMGGSYGGYATLAGLTFTPELYRCGVDLVGISNVASFMKSIPPYWQPLRYEWVTRVGDAENNATLNRAISPLFHVDKIRAPLLIAQGANDPRVPQPESDQMFRAMKAKGGLDVQYVLYPDEGHGLDRSDNRVDYYSRVEQFLAKHLRGRAAPPLAVPGASARVVRSEDDLTAIALEAAEQEAREAAAAAKTGGGAGAPPASEARPVISARGATGSGGGAPVKQG